MEKIVEKWSTAIYEVTIGATQEDGGSRSKRIKVGNQMALPFLDYEGPIPNPPAVAIEVWDMNPGEEWPYFSQEFKDIVDDPIKWIKAAEQCNPDLICFRLASCHPDRLNTSPEGVTKIITQIKNSTSLPLIIIGCGHIEKDIDVLTAASNALKGEQVLLGMAVKDNYRTIAATALANGHSVIAESPLDINLAKQLNILISDAGLPLNRIVMHPTTGGLGYGFEYCYTIMERSRIAGLQGDKVMATPIINMVSQETWKLKEAKATIEEQPNWGELSYRSKAWEIATSVGYLQSGADIVVVAHPETVTVVKKIISTLMQKC